MSTLRNNRGVTLVFVAMGLLIFLLFLGLALDTGWLVYVRAQSQARIDSAALAAAAALIEPIPAGERENRAIELANVFGDKNSVVNSMVDPENIVTPMTYDENSGNLDEASGWKLWEGSRPICNAVRVTTTVPTPVFFTGIFGTAEAGPENINVSAVSHLPCPGVKITSEKLAQFAIARTAGNFEYCDSARPLETLNAALWKVTAVPVPVQVEELISLPSSPPLTRDDLTSLPQCGDSAIVPVVDGSGNSKKIVGLASICWTDVAGGSPTVTLKCGEVAPSSAGVGECFGTYASNPILIQ